MLTAAQYNIVMSFLNLI